MMGRSGPIVSAFALLASCPRAAAVRHDRGGGGADAGGDAGDHPGDGAGLRREAARGEPDPTIVGAVPLQVRRRRRRGLAAGAGGGGKLAIGLADGLLQSDFARPVLVSLIVPQIVGRIGQEDCGTIDRLVTQLEPLPPRNAAGVVVTALSYLRAQRAKGQRVDVPDLPLCADRLTP